jgi:hypothetical protein
MANSFDFTTSIPSTRIGRPEYAGLSEPEIKKREADRLVGRNTERPRRPRQWQELPLDPRVLELLKFDHCPDNGMPLPPKWTEPVPPSPTANDAALSAYEGRRYRLYEAFKEADRTYMERFNFWLRLDNCQKTALLAHVRWGAETTPLWICEHEHDVEYGPTPLHAADGLQAMERYRECWGIIPWEDDDGRRQITPVSIRRIDEPTAAPFLIQPKEEPSAP